MASVEILEGMPMMGEYATDEGYYSVGEFGIEPASQASPTRLTCPPGVGYKVLPDGTYACAPFDFVATYVWGPQGSFWTKLPLRLAVLAGVGALGYRVFKKRRAVAGLGCGCEEE